MAPTSSRWPIWPVIDHARPCKCHGTMTHVTAAATGVCWHHPLSEHHRLAPFHWCRRTCPHEWLYRIIMNISRRARAVWPWESTRNVLELSWNNSKPTPCLLVRPTYQATSHHAAAAACVLNARAPLGVTHHTNERARETSTTAPPCPLPTHSTRGTGRAIANEPGFVSRVVVVVVSSVVCLGLLQKSQTAAGTVVGNKYTRHSGLVSMFRP